MTTETTWRLDGRTAIITGAAGLIGSALSAGFAANGAHVVMVDRDGDGLARLAARTWSWWTATVTAWPGWRLSSAGP